MVSVVRTAASKRAALFLSGGFSTGAVLASGGTSIVPQFSVDGLTMREEGYTETGGGDGVDLKVDPYYGKSLRAYLGTSIRQDLNFGDFFLQPEARVGYRYDFLADPAKIKASFASVTPASFFTLTGPRSRQGQSGRGRQPLGDHRRLVDRPELRLHPRQRRRRQPERHHLAGGTDLAAFLPRTYGGGVANEVKRRRG